MGDVIAFPGCKVPEPDGTVTMFCAWCGSEQAAPLGDHKCPCGGVVFVNDPAFAFVRDAPPTSFHVIDEEGP